MKKQIIRWGLILSLLLSLLPAGTWAANGGAESLFTWTADASVSKNKAAITDNLITFDATATTKSNTHYVKELDVTTAQGKAYYNAYFIGASWFKHSDGTLYGLPSAKMEGISGQNEYRATEGLDLSFTNGVNVDTKGKDAVNVSFVYAATTHTASRVDTNVFALDKLKIQVAKNGNDWLDGSVGIRSWELIGRETVADKLTTYLFRIETEDLMTIDGLNTGDTINNLRMLPHGDYYYAWPASYFGICDLTVNGYATAADFNTAVPNERNDMVYIGEQKMRDIVIARAQTIARKEWKTDTDIIAYNKNCFYGAGILYRGPMYARSVKSGNEIWREWIDADGNYIGAKEGADVSGMDCMSFAYDAFSVVSRSHSWILWQTQADNSSYRLGDLKVIDKAASFTTQDILPFNTPEDVYKAYAQLKKGDIVDSTAHIMLASRDAVVVYKEDGTIDPDKSFVPTIEEQSTARFYFKGETGDIVIVWPTYITGTDSKQPTLEQVQAYAKENDYTFLYASSPREDDYSFTKLLQTNYVPRTLKEYDTGEVEAVDLQILMMPKDGGNVTSGFTVAAAMDHFADRMRVTLEKKDGTVLYEDSLLSNGSAGGRPRQYNHLWSYDSSEEMNKVLKGLSAGDYRIGVYMLAGYVTEVGADKSEVVEYYDFSYNGIPAKEKPDHSCPALAMTDVANEAWYHNAVDYALTNGLMSGYNATTFGPNDTLSRAMVVQVLYNKEGQPAITGTHKFPDVKSGDWFNNAVTWGAQKGVVGGYGDGRFGPNDAVTIQQIAVILWNYSGNPEFTGTPDGMGKYDDWAKNGLSWAVENGIMKDVPVANATDNATRAQTAQILMNFVKGAAEESQPTAPSGINNHTHTDGWKSLNNAIAGIQPYSGVYVMGTSVPGGKYYLTEDLDLGSNYIQLNAGIGDITVCLNGHTISSTSKMVFRFNNNCDANLTICDCSAGQTGKVALANRVKGTDYQVTSATVLARSSGTFNLYGGTLVGGVSCVSTNVNIYGGKIQALADGEVLYIHGTATGKINIEGGEFEGYNGKAPRLVHRGTGSVILYGGEANTTAGAYNLVKSGDQYELQK